MTSLIRHVTSRLFFIVAFTGVLSVASANDLSAQITKLPISSIPPPMISLAAKDWDSLRAWFHQPQFNISDGLDCYNSDYRGIADKYLTMNSPNGSSRQTRARGVRHTGKLVSRH